MYATLEGVGSARALAGLCSEHNAFRWIAGGVSVNYHTLADFRTAHLGFRDDLLTHSVAVPREQDLVDPAASRRWRNTPGRPKTR